MSDELEDLRPITRRLRPHPDAAMLDRVRVGVRARISVPPSPWEVLAGWLRPAAVSFATIVVLIVVAFTLAPEPIAPEAMADEAERIVIREANLAGP
jgi:hypothetical protein